MNDKSEHTIDSAAWSGYWQKGFQTTFVGENEESYGGEIRDYWKSCFDTLSANTTLLDIGTGNGALLSLFDEFAQTENKPVNLVGIDFAEISNDKFSGKQHIRLIANTRLENSGLEPDSIDLCSSQFGFEYAELDPAAAELARIIKPGGRLHALIHHADSPVTEASKSAIAQIDLCYRSRLTEIAKQLLLRLRKLDKSSRDPKTDEKAEKLRNEFNRVASRLTQYTENIREPAHVNYYLGEITGVFSNLGTALQDREKMDILEQVESDSASYRLRMASMLGASKSQAQIQQVKESLEHNGFQVDSPGVLQKDGISFAWIMQAKARQ